MKEEIISPLIYNLPECCNRGCHQQVHVIRTSNTGKVTFRPLCSSCYNAGRGLQKYKPGVTPIKKDYCENIDDRLGFVCTTTILGSYQCDLDHKDGNHYNNHESNIQTVCKCCHAYKSKHNGDHDRMKHNKKKAA
jgi:hypothetical protein